MFHLLSKLFIKNYEDYTCLLYTSRSVVGTGLSFDTVHDDRALSVRTCQHQLRHRDNVIIICALREERGKPVSYTHLDVYKRQLIH